MPNYMSRTITGYLMNQDGNSFDQTPAGGSAATPFRPYFEAASPNQAGARSILFANIDSPFDFGGSSDPSGDDFGDGDLVFAVRRHTISATSSLRDKADVHIYNVGGLAVTSFTVQPGETVETHIPVAGVYIIRAANGRILKKIAVR